MAAYLNLSRHPGVEHVASLRLCPNVFHQLGTSNSDQTVNGRLPHALLRLHDEFQTVSLTVLRGQSLFFPLKTCSMGHPHVFSIDLPRSALRRPQNQATSEMPGHPTSNLY